MKTVAILLIVIGGIMTVFTGFNLVTKKEVADIAFNTVSDFLKQNDFINKVYFVCFDDENYQLYKSLIR